MNEQPGELGEALALLRRIARELDLLKRDSDASVRLAASRLNRCELASLIIGARRQRQRFFDMAMFGEPAWDILLDLYVSHCTDRAVCISDACIASGVPATTALRWITILATSSLVARKIDVDDRRRAFLALSDEGLQKVEEYLDCYAAWIINNQR